MNRSRHPHSPTPSGIPGRNFIAASFALVLAACGGGGGGDTTTTASAPAPAPAPAPASYWIAGVAGPNVPSLGASTLYVIDPANPTVPLLTRSLPTSAVTPWGVSEAVSQTEGRFVAPHSDVSFVEGGQVKYLDLNKAVTTAVRQLSSAATACDVLWGYRVFFGTSNLESHAVRLDGGSGCTNYTTALAAHFPSSLGAADATPATVSYYPLGYGFMPIADFATGTYAHVQMETSAGVNRLAVFTTGGSRIGDVQNASGFTSPSWYRIAFPEGAGLSTLVIVDGAVRRLSWSGTTASLGSSLYTMTAVTSAVAGGATTNYFGDGAAIKAVEHGSSTVGTALTLPVTSGYALMTTANSLVAAFAPSTGCPSSRKCLQVIIKPNSGAANITRFIEGTAAAAPVLTRAIYENNQLYLIKPQDDGTKLPALLSTTDGTDTVLASDAIHVGYVSRTDRRPSYAFGNSGALYCIPDAAAVTKTCAGRPLMQIDFATSATPIMLGTIPSNSSGGLYSQPSVATYAAVTSAINFSVNSLYSDLYIVTPGTANSLKFVAAQP